MSAVGETVFGVQEPRFSHSPAGVVDNRAGEAIELMAAIGMPLDPWQQSALQVWLGERADGTWAATSAGAVVARQNGKNALLEARELAGLFLFGERRIVHSAHQADTAREAYKRMRVLIESTPWLEAEVRQMPKAPGQEAIILKSGAELSYRTRTAGGGRGFSAPIVVLDEAQELTGEQLAAIQPLISSFSRRQLIYTGTVLPGANVFQGVVERGRRGLSASLGYVEWSAPEDCDPSDVGAWLQANPSVGYRMTVDAIRDEWETAVAALTEDKFAQERLSIWPNVGGVGSVIPIEAWASAVSEWRPPFNISGGVMSVAVSMDRTYAVVAYAVPCPSGVFVEAIAQTGDLDRETGEARVGIDWVLPFVAGVASRRLPEAVIVDKAGPAFPLVNAMIASGLPVRVTELSDWKSACALFVDEVVAGRVAHSGQVQVSEAAQGVLRRVVGDAWVYDRKTPGVRVAPLEAVTLAAWGITGSASAPSKYESHDLLVLG